MGRLTSTVPEDSTNSRKVHHNSKVPTYPVLSSFSKSVEKSQYGYIGIACMKTKHISTKTHLVANKWPCTQTSLKSNLMGKPK